MSTSGFQSPAKLLDHSLKVLYRSATYNSGTLSKERKKEGRKERTVKGI
jgi:hypothetical protein